MIIALGTITVDVPDCPVVIPLGIPSWAIAWGIVVTTVILLALIIAVAVTRSIAHEEHTNQETARRNAEVALAKNHKTCTTCGARYEPTVKIE